MTALTGIAPEQGTYEYDGDDGEDEEHPGLELALERALLSHLRQSFRVTRFHEVALLLLQIEEAFELLPLVQNTLPVAILTRCSTISASRSSLSTFCSRRCTLSRS